MQVSVTENALIVSWADTAVPPGSEARAYRIYRALADPSQQNPPADLSQAKLKTPLELVGTSPSSNFAIHFGFASQYLYTVRSLAQYGGDFVESADSAPVVVTPRDIFPPATPTGLEAAVVLATPQAPTYVELSWAISPEGDLAGYSVYRSDAQGAPSERISTETLLSPAFRDISVVSGRR